MVGVDGVGHREEEAEFVEERKLAMEFAAAFGAAAGEVDEMGVDFVEEGGEPGDHGGRLHELHTLHKLNQLHRFHQLNEFHECDLGLQQDCCVQ